MSNDTTQSITRRTALLGGSALAVGLPACGEVINQTLKLRIGITAALDGKTFSNETVIERQFKNIVGGSASIRFRRHAPYVSLGDRQILFLPKSGGNQPQVGFGGLIYGAYGVTGGIERLQINEKEIMGRRGVVEVDLVEMARRAKLPKYPEKISFIHFPDRRDKTLARWKTIKQLDDDFGIEIKSITFEAVKAPLTDVIKTLLPWIDGVEPDRLSFDDAGFKADGDLDQSHSVHRHIVSKFDLIGNK